MAKSFTMNRRDFIQTSATAAAAMCLPSFDFIAKRKIGLQLYSLRDIIKKDLSGVLKQVASFGYTELEIYDYKDGKILGAPVSDFGKMVSDLGMRAVSGHFGTDVFPVWEKAVNDAKAIGMEYMVIPSLSDEQRGSIRALKSTCDSINKNAELCKKVGVRMGYHNHAQEFAMVDGKLIYDVMLIEFDPKLVSMELDLYWVAYANHDPLKLFEAHPGRFEQWHVKDMNKTDRELNADVGTGMIDFKPIFAKAKQAGLKHFYVEQETYPVSPMESVKACAKNIPLILN